MLAGSDSPRAGLRVLVGRGSGCHSSRIGIMVLEKGPEFQGRVHSSRTGSMALEKGP